MFMAESASENAVYKLSAICSDLIVLKTHLIEIYIFGFLEAYTLYSTLCCL